MDSSNPETWRISAEERTKHNATFMQLGPVGGTHLTGDQAKAFFLKSGLAMLVLGQIWNLADLNKDGKLDAREFSIACYLIKKALTHSQGPACIPATLPAGLLIEPVMSSSTPVAPAAAATTPAVGIRPPPTTTAPVTTTPLIQPPTSAPLFQANFPPLTQTPIVGIPPTTPTPTQPAMFPAMQPLVRPTLTSAGAAVTTPLVPGLTPASTSTPMMTSAASPAFATPLVNPAIPNPLSPIPQTSRSKYGQMFQSNDPNSTGFLSGTQAKTLLIQTGLSQPILAQIWNLADFDKDGKLTYEEFILAMHLCDYARTGATLPSILPVDLHPAVRSRSSSLLPQMPAGAQAAAVVSPPGGGGIPAGAFDSISQASSDSSPTLATKQQQMMAATFEDKRRENFDRGNAVLEAKRAALREQEEREKRERDEKERLEQEKRQRIREEQEKRRLAEIERAQERQRQLDAQREEERRKLHEQREQARNELIRQQRLEWEKQKRLELEQGKLKLQEQLSTLKAKDKNLEYDLQVMNDKISSYKTKISDNQASLSEINQRIELSRRGYAHKQVECESAEKELKEVTAMLSRLGQEKLVLNEQLKNLNADSPFAEEYRTDSSLLKQKQSAIQQLRADLESIEAKINTTRTQLEIVKHELEVARGDEAEYARENDRLQSLLDIKRGVVGPNTVGGAAMAKMVGSMSNGSLAKQISNPALVKSSQSNGSLRSATPKENYDAFKDEIMRMQQQQQTTTTNRNASEYNADWSNAFDAPAVVDPFASGVDPFASASLPTSHAGHFDPFGNNTSTNLEESVASNALVTSASGFGDDNWAAFPAPTTTTTTNTTDLPTSPSTNNGFDTTNNAAKVVVASGAGNVPPPRPPPVARPPPPAANLTADASNLANNAADENFSSPNNNNDNNWAAFDDDGPIGGGIKNQVDFFSQQQQQQQQQQAAKSSMTASSSFQSKLGGGGNMIKYRAMYQFDATRDDELTVHEGDMINVDPSIATDEGWVWGECAGRVGVFPASFAMKLDEFEQLQMQMQMQQPAADYSALSNAASSSMQAISNVSSGSQIKNYYMSVYAYDSSEPGDLVFREYEIINVVSQNEDWFTGEVVGSEMARRGIFPVNFVIKFNLPLEYIGKHTISIATEPYAPINTGELPLDPTRHQLIAIKKVSPDGKWSFGESFEDDGRKSKGWFPIGSASALIDAGVPPITPGISGGNANTTGPKTPTSSSFATPTTATTTNFVGTSRVSESPSNPQLAASSSSNQIASSSPQSAAPAVPTSPSQQDHHHHHHNQQQQPESTTEQQQQQPPASPPAQVIDRVVALYDFEPTTPEAIGFPKDAIINILDKSGDWWYGEYNGKIGILPYNYVQSIGGQSAADNSSSG